MMGFVVLGLATLAAGSIIVSTLRLGIGPTPTSRAVREVMLELLPESTSGVVYELGSGWGGLARAVARRCPRARVIGVEASVLPWAFAALVQGVARVPNLSFVRGDFHAQPLREADVLVCYLFTGGMRTLAERGGFKPGAVLVSSTFALPGHTPETTVRARDLYGSPVYRYKLESGHGVSGS
jgi:hypothetical protein